MSSIKSCLDSVIESLVIKSLRAEIKEGIHDFTLKSNLSCAIVFESNPSEALPFFSQGPQAEK